ncbi:DUF6339 family protein [Staphylococcus aureus]|uniref:DUF6339 family protein n=1 Tax=Staphylococcus TaxID=1279 RepID=UPI0015E5D837|nr:DUF6339 family protein [Staphylococcus aureus]MCS5244651.1 DUF6339 family protein [Staphylococcus aureus]MCS5269828.1 DUF6339 family protein [Staphylococcus aureus]MCS5281190.1 DUF6339 family protein [Staphylococcus aureus]MDN8673215.1 DUF6339 family protein [Staphylococcus aureus]MDN8969572.1 DUF6339 family protein [Staphylococcus aureus]
MSGHLTYDSTREDPYELTKFFCESDFSARAVIFFSSNFTSNKELGLGILSAIYRLKQNGVDIKQDYFVQANKYLNLIGGVTLLDLKTRAEVEEEIYGYLKDNGFVSDFLTQIHVFSGFNIYPFYMGIL